MLRHLSASSRPSDARQPKVDELDSSLESLPVVRCCLFVLLVLGGLVALYFSAFHFWAGTGPPSIKPMWHFYRARFFCGLGVALLAGAPLSVWLFRPKKQSGSVEGSS